jgi:hypothetical protein
MIFGTRNIFTTTPNRHAESTDTRQAIGRHEPDQQRRRTPREDEPGDLFDLDDEAYVSVESLRLFLENYKRTQDVQTVDAATENKGRAGADTPMPIDQKPLTTAPYAAQAAKAYESMAKAAKPEISADSAANQGAGASSAGGADFSTVDRLLADLDLLALAGVETLHIQRAVNFLVSLLNAVEREKARLNIAG